MPGQVTGASWLQNWLRGMQGAGTKWLDGVNKTTINPTAAAATPQAMQNYIDGVQRSVQDGTRAAGLAASTLQDWQAGCKAKSGSLASGAAAAANKSKTQQMANNLANAANAASAAAQALPKGNVQLGNARYLAAQQAFLASMGK